MINKFHYSVILSIIYKQEFCEKTRIFSALECLTQKNVTDENYLETIKVCSEHLKKQLREFNSRTIQNFVSNYEDDVERSDDLCPCEAQKYCLAEIRRHLDKEWFEVEPFSYKKDMSEYFWALKRQLGWM